MTTKTAAEIVRRLQAAYPDAACSLVFRSPIQIVVATMLSAQSTDERVNLVTPALFREYPSVRALARAGQAELEKLIKPVGLFRSKARNIIALAQQLESQHRSRVPRTVKELQVLPGIGRKSANVIRGELTGEGEGIAVDTHVMRLAFRLGLTRHRDPKQIEQDLMRQIDRSDWVLIAHLLISHGRAVCQARRPHCNDCVMLDICPQRGLSKIQLTSASEKISASKP